MPSLSFFPWLPLRQNVEFEKLSLLVYQRGHLPSGFGTPTQNALDSILTIYLYSPKLPVENAVILRIKDKEIDANHDEDDRAFLFGASQIITCAGLASRRFFNHFSYWNSDDFTFATVNYKDPAAGAVITTRRRDGVGTHIIADSQSFHYNRPIHTNPTNCFLLDESLGKALFLAMENDERWPEYLDAINGFNRANTDSLEISEEQEVVLLVGAFQRLLGGHYREKEVIQAFEDRLGKYFQLDAKVSSRLSQAQNVKDQFVGPAWMRNLHRLRNGFAHGSRKIKSDQKWNTKEHLLLGSYLFPLLLKETLSDDGYYVISKEDVIDLKIFENRADVDFMNPVKHKRDNDEWLWNTVWHDAIIHSLVEELAEQFQKKVEQQE